MAPATAHAETAAGASDRLVVLDAAHVRASLSHEAAYDAVRSAMIELSSGRVRQHLRSFLGLEPGRTFAMMPAAFEGRGVFGAKLVSVTTDAAGARAHHGLVVLFDGESGQPVCVADAAAVTAIRTAAASAVATEALARWDAKVLAVLGTGLQSQEHIAAIASTRELSEVRVWGRSPERARALARRMTLETGVPVRAAADVERAVAGADIVCTITSAEDPILSGEQIGPGVHLNIVGSSGPGPAEIDEALVAKSRYFVDHAEHARVHSGDLLRALAKGAIGEDHIQGEIGEVLSGAKPGRTSDNEITIYKSLGHAVQDLAVAQWLYERAK
jgi:ornithine cyclodeaminase/alanine dehydrogenase-like protein (mu-crystallin family)